MDTFHFHAPPVEKIKIGDLRPMQFVACRYDNFWWIGLIQKIDAEFNDIEIKFMHPHGPTKSFHWPHRDDICFVPLNEVLCILEALETTSGRMYSLKDKDYMKICSCLI